MTKLRLIPKRLWQLVVALWRLPATISNLAMQLDELKVNQGAMLSQINRQKNSLDLKDYEFKVFSQWGEDGIIQHLIDILKIPNKTFIEFGVEDFFESNCRFLLTKDNWRGFVIDGSRKNMDRLRASHFFWKYHIHAIDAFITRDNINDLLSLSGFGEDLGILSVDIDGNDYYILEAIRNFKPCIIICEYNFIFGKDRKISVPYEPDFLRTEKHFSNLYFGCSLAALVHLANSKGYAFVGTNSIGGNAFFVRNDLLNERLQVLSAKEAYFETNVRESRDKTGQLTYLSGTKRSDLISGMPVFNVETKQIESL